MYQDYFGLKSLPFSIAPDPRYLYLSESHKEALAHLMYGIQGQGGFIVITGEVGTGKTTVCRCFLEQVPAHVDIALLVNPKLSARELLGTICDELKIPHPAGATIKRLIDQINQALLAAHATGRHTVLIIDEAQNLAVDVLEQLRLLTNLETSEKKLLQIVLLGQPELNEILASHELRQLAQRVTARYHLGPLAKDELNAYLRYRLGVAGLRTELFEPAAQRQLYAITQGIPRLVNLVCDRALLGAYANGARTVDAALIRGAAREVFGERPAASRKRHGWVWMSVAVALVGSVWLTRDIWRPVGEAPVTDALATQVSGEQPLSQPSVTEAAPLSVPEPAVVAAPVAASGQIQRMPDWRDTLDPSLATRQQAFASLFEAWGYDATTESRAPCDQAELFGLRCLSRQGNWQSLIALNHPSVLHLYDGAGRAYFATLLGVEGERVTLQLGERRVEADTFSLESQWRGEYTLLWRLPPYASALILPGEYLDEATWLEQQLTRALAQFGSQADRSRLQGASLTERVRWYQQVRGLAPDGIAGTMTLMQLGVDLDGTLPLLTPTARVPTSIQGG